MFSDFEFKTKAWHEPLGPFSAVFCRLTYNRLNASWTGVSVPLPEAMPWGEELNVMDCRLGLITR